MKENGLPDWDERILHLGNPCIMDNLTFIEWATREMETEGETAQRLEEMAELHRLWHKQNPGIYVCCIQTPNLLVKMGAMSVNEARVAQERIKQQLEDYRSGSRGLIVLDEGMSVELLPTAHPSD